MRASIYAVAPGYPYQKSSLDLAIKKIQARGHGVYCPSGTLKPYRFYSNREEKRFQFLLEALTDPSYDVVWAIRGGYGSNRLLPYLNQYKKELKKIKPKIFLGLSDITSLHLFLNQVLGWKTWHAPVLESLGREEFPQSQWPILEQILKSNTVVGQSYSLKPLNQAARDHQFLRSCGIVGGNLTVFQSHLGTALLGSIKRGSLLFFEDVGERGYRIDRMLWQIKQTSLFPKVQGILFGEFTGGQESNGQSFISQVLKEFAQSVSCPVFSGIASGHGQGYRSLPFGSPVEIHKQRLILDPIKDQRKK
jgi:muramoyltetrapeptide carboxypeptidase